MQVAAESMRLIHRAIDARACEALSEIAYMAGDDERGFDLQEDAASIAIAIAFETATMPLLFANSELLREAWQETHNLRELQEKEEQAHEAAKTWQAKVIAHIKAGEWESLDLPTPQDALNTLLAGEQIEANGHTAQYDVGDDITWLTNAYGIDGILCNKPDLRAVTSFLTDMAKGIEYGPVPY